MAVMDSKKIIAVLITLITILVVVQIAMQLF